jgi:hypothetical protein
MSSRSRLEYVYGLVSRWIEVRRAEVTRARSPPQHNKSFLNSPAPSNSPEPQSYVPNSRQQLKAERVFWISGYITQ